jgi:hypothetical protein
MMGSVMRLAASGTGCFQAAVLTSCHHAAAVGTSCRFTGSLAPAKPVITIPVKVRKEFQDKSIRDSRSRKLCPDLKDPERINHFFNGADLGKRKKDSQTLKDSVVKRVTDRT